MSVLPPADQKPYQVCLDGNYTGWMDLFYCIEPHSWAFLGLAFSLGFSIIGASW